jgi:hypothetical protein
LIGIIISSSSNESVLELIIPSPDGVTIFIYGFLFFLICVLITRSATIIAICSGTSSTLLFSLDSLFLFLLELNF